MREARTDSTVSKVTQSLCWRHFKSSTKAIRQQEKHLKLRKIRIWQNSKKVGTKNLSTPDFGKGKPEQPNVMAYS